MKDNLKEIYEILKQDSRLVNEEGEFLKNKIQELTLKTDAELLKVLLKNQLTRDMFFTKVEETFVFDKNKFIWVIDSKDFLPDSYTAFVNKVMLVNEKGNSIGKSDDVVLSFPCKDCLVEMDSTEDTDERNEVFFNEVLMKSELDTLLEPKVFTNVKKYLKDNEEEVTTINDNDNLIIKGNNLLALHSLLPRYVEEIKLIYWDILYNTDNDKVPYNDSFKHSSWLTMMKNRLDVAKKLLKNDGILCLQCDDNEMAYLKVLCDEIFHRENFVNCIVVKMSEASGIKMSHTEKRLPKLKEYILLYKKRNIKLNKIKVPKEVWDNEYKTVITEISKEELSYIKNVIQNEKRTKEEFDKCSEILNKAQYKSLSEVYKENSITGKDEKIKFNYENSYRIFRTTAMSNGIPTEIKLMREKIKDSKFFCYITPKNKMYVIKGDYNTEATKPRIQLIFADSNLMYNPCDLWQDIKTTGLDNEGTVALKNGKKPEMLIKRIIELTTQKGDIVLDAYLGSGTTASVAHKMERQYIGIEQLDLHVEKSLTRMKNVLNGEQTGISKIVDWQGEGSFIYCELANNSQSFINKVGQAGESELLKLYKELKEKDFVSYRVDINELESQKDGFLSLPEKEKRRFLINVIDKNTLYINYSEMNDISYGISDNIKQFNNNFYNREV